MNKLILCILSMAVPLFIGVQSVYAERGAESLDAHVHGLSELTIAMDAKSIEIQLISPAMNLVGFEHKATSKQDIAAVKKAELILGQQDSLFLIAGGDCEYLSTSIDSGDLLESESHHEKHDDHDKHNDHDDHEKHDDHDDHDGHDQGETHSEMVASYSYTCKDSSKLSSLTVGLFTSFTGIHKINTLWVTPSKQGSNMLSAKNPTIEFSY
jgi:hypothetical protein